ncbi:hypothetical protein ACFCY8_11190 [Streptomyces noursei]|uniref:hypothetical protein n=1 Tax=Streptomyces noursei TaxID=1971 RepID=UPI0035D56D94
MLVERCQRELAMKEALVVRAGQSSARREFVALVPDPVGAPHRRNLVDLVEEHHSIAAPPSADHGHGVDGGGYVAAADGSSGGLAFAVTARRA